MRTTGISIDGRQICAVVVERNAITWSQCREIDTPDGMLPALAQLLSAVPGRPRTVSLAVGSPWCHVKRIDGLPTATDMGALTQVITANSASFFLSGGARLAVPAVIRTANGALWASAFDASTIESIVGTLRERGTLVRRVLPSVYVVSRLCIAGAHPWIDGHERVELLVGQGGAWESVRRVRASERLVLPTFPDANASARTDWRFAAAFGAATADRRALFALRPQDRRRAASTRRLRVAVAGTLVALTAIAVLAAPALRAHHDIDTIARRRAGTPASATEAATLRRDVDSIDRSLSRLAMTDRERGRVTPLLAALTEALPDSCAIVSLHLDSLAATMSVLTPHASEVVAALTALPGIDGVRLTGSVTRDVIGAVRLDRATVRFRIAAQFR